LFPRRWSRDGHPAPLGQAFIEYGRIAKTLNPAVPGQARAPQCLGRYAFTTQPPAELRPLRDPNARDGEDDGEF